MANLDSANCGEGEVNEGWLLVLILLPLQGVCIYIEFLQFAKKCSGTYRCCNGLMRETKITHCKEEDSQKISYTAGNMRVPGKAPQALLGGHHFLQVSKATQLNEWNSNFPRDNQIPKVMLIVSTLQSYWKTYLHQKLWNKSQRREPEHKPSQKVRKCSATPKKNQQYLRDRKQQCIESCPTSRTPSPNWISRSVSSTLSLVTCQNG